LWVHHNRIYKANNYVAAIDLEPPSTGYAINDIWITDNTVKSTSIYFISTNNFAGTTSKRIWVEGNSVEADYLFRTSIASVVDVTDITIRNNTHFGGDATNNYFVLLNTAARVTIIGNSILTSSGTITANITTVDDVIFSNNYFATTAKTAGPTFDECNRVLCTGNHFEGVSSVNGALIFQSTGGAATTGHVIANNVIKGANYGLVIKDNEITDTCFIGNFIDASGRCIDLQNTAATTELIGSSNMFAGGGNPLFNPTNLLRVHDQRYLQTTGNTPRWMNGAAPTTGTNAAGDLAYEVAPAAGKHVGYVCVVGGTPGTWKQFASIDSQDTLVWDPGSLADGAGETSSAITIAGSCAFGDYVLVAAPYDLQGITCTAYVSAPDTVKIRLQNESTGVLDLASGTWRVKVIRASA
jgi:hypothetical protein